MKNQIIGLVRFSYPSIGGFSRGDELAEVTAALYDPVRLERRFHLFEGLTLPSLLNQTDQDFKVVILIGRDFPALWHDRLRDVLAPLKQAQIVVQKPALHYPATKRAFAHAVDDDATHITGFRLDDDDGLDKAHIARMRKNVEAFLPVVGDHISLVTGCNRGLFLYCQEGENRICKVVEKAPLGLGLAMTAPRERGENIFRRNHRLCGQFYNTYTDISDYAFIRTVHDYNDSSAMASGSEEELTWDDAAVILTNQFGLDAERLKKL